jgi:hypothetical protein
MWSPFIDDVHSPAMSYTYTNRWSASDRQAFADGVRLCASTIAGRRRPGPSADEWNWDEDEEVAA